MSSYLRSLDKVMEVAVAGIISTAVMIATNIIFLLVIKIGIYGYLLSMVLGPLVASVYCIAKAEVRGREYVKNVCSTAVQKEMLRYCAPLIFNNIALWINAFWTNILLQQFVEWKQMVFMQLPAKYLQF